MGAAYFYHLTQSSLENALLKLLPRARAAGWRIEIRGTEMTHLKRLDAQLWNSPADDFLPHGLAGNSVDALQPILLSVGPSGQTCECIMTVNGADISADEVRAAERVCVMFDGANEDALNIARGQWKQLTDEDCSAQYWSEASGQWEKKAEK